MSSETCYFVFYFFVQAEDGIRDLVRSRGLGDVYKRQEELAGMNARRHQVVARAFRRALGQHRRFDVDEAPVSYTHLTLPTSDLV